MDFTRENLIFLKKRAVHQLKKALFCLKQTDKNENWVACILYEKIVLKYAQNIEILTLNAESKEHILVNILCIKINYTNH